MPILKPIIAILAVWSTVGWSDAQSTAARTFEHFVVAIGPEESTEGTWFRIDWDNGQVGTFLVSDVFGPSTLARDLSVYGTSRLIVQFGHVLALVDPASGTVIDRFAGLRVAGSPSGRYLAIQRYTPNGVDFVDSVYSIYDLATTPSANRAEGLTTIAAGSIVYPMANVLAQRYSVAKQPNDAHDLLSALTWIGPQLLAFVDCHAGAATLVLVDVESGASQFKRTDTSLNTVELLKPNTDVAQLRFIRVKDIEVLSSTGSNVWLRLVFEPSGVLQVMELNVQAARPQ